jgi:AcrR family transcriptional regulator
VPGNQRADARRNRERVISAARTVFATKGVGAGMEIIARRARVGVGTLYRHFATKEALLAAVVAEQIHDTAQRAREAASAGDPGTAFYALLRVLWLNGLKKKTLVDALRASGADLRALVPKASSELHDALGALLKRAQAAKAVRRDLRPADLVALLGGALDAASRPGASPQRVVDVILAGLKP